MQISEKNGVPRAMAFYNPDGLVPALKQARAFAGKDGRVATLPDVLDARMKSPLGTIAWERYFTTMSAEYVGLSRGGFPIAIVAHGIGPMSTLDGILKAYSFEYKDKTRNKKGGRISQEEFWKLEDGVYGEVSVVDLVATWKRREYAFSNHAITMKEIEDEPLWRARLGKHWRDYVVRHSSFARLWDRQQSNQPYVLPCILAMDDASGCSYSIRELFDRMMEQAPNMAIGHLLTIGGLCNSHHQYYERDYKCRENRTSLACDIGGHGWSNGTRFLGVRSEKVTEIHSGLPSYEMLVATKLNQLWGPNPNGFPCVGNGFWHLVQVGEKFFTDYPKDGERMDNHAPEFLITKIEEIDEGTKQFRTTIGGYHGFFKYGINEVQAIAPHGANAYTVGNVEIEWKEGNPTHHVADVTFYKVEVDTSKRLLRNEDIYRDFDLMMSLID